MSWRPVVLLSIVLLLACDPPAEEMPPVSPSPAPYVAQTNNYTTNVYVDGSAVINPPAETIAPSPALSTTREDPTSDTSSSSSAPESAPRVAVIVPTEPVKPPLPRNLASTGVRECDAYLARLESCSSVMLAKVGDGGSALHRMEESFDLMRRSWRRAAALHSMTREALVDECATSLHIYNEAVAGTCSD